jgi:hypothetical protein
MQGYITVRTLTGKNTPIYVDFRQTIGALKQQIAYMEGIPPTHQSLLFMGRKLLDQWTLADCGITNGHTVFLILHIVPA